MPISECDYAFDSATDHHHQMSNEAIATSTTNTMMSKAELRKTHKPIIEKRRRAKINNCLNEIKDLILGAMKKDPERHSKLEKADILEMAVKHLKSIQKQQKEFAIRTDPNVAMKYKTGFLECAAEVSSYVDQIDGVDAGLKHRLTNHLHKQATSVDQQRQSCSGFSSSSLLASFAAQSRFNQADDQNNNARSIQGIEVIPSCLPNGDFAFLVPKASFNSILNSERSSAFVTVAPRSAQSYDGLLKIAKPLSPPISPQEQPTHKVQVIKPKAEKAIVSSSADIPAIKNIKFPIQRKEHIAEPLCIITNSSERYRQAQQVPESRLNEENVYAHGLKRKANDDGLLTVAPHHVKVPRIAGLGSSAFNHVNHDISKEDAEFEARNNKDNNDQPDNDKNEPMWRPW